MIQSLHDEGKDALLNTWDPVQFVMQNRVSEDIFFNKKNTAKKKKTDQDDSNLNIISNRMSALSDEIINLKLNIPDGTCLGYIVTNNFNQESNTCDYSIIHPLHFATDNKYQIDYKWYLDHKLQSKLDSYLILEKSAPSKPGSTGNDNKDYYAELRNPEFIANAISKRLTAAYSTEFNRSIEELNKDPYVLSEMRKKK